MVRRPQQRISPQPPLDLVQNERHSEATFQRVNRLLNGEQPDFLMIDWDRRYSGVRTDYKPWTLLVRKGRCVAIHDVFPFKKDGNRCEGYRLCGERQNVYPDYIEIARDREQGWAKIGSVSVH